MDMNPLHRVFPERNRDALEGSPEHDALEAGRDTVPTTFGHAATKVWEILSPHMSPEHVQKIVLDLFPVESHRDEVPQGSVGIISHKAERLLRNAFVLPLIEEQQQCGEKVRKALEPLAEEADTAGFIPLSRLHSWLQTATIHSYGALDAAGVRSILISFAYALGTDWEKELLPSGAPSSEIVEYFLSSYDLKTHFAEVVAEFVFTEKMQNVSNNVQGIHQQILGLFILTPEKKAELMAKYPIGSSN